MGPAANEPPHFLSLVWSTFFSGLRLGEHAWYFGKIWNPDRQRLQHIEPAWLPVEPFWRSLDPSYRVAILDLPYATSLPAGPNMTVLNGWQCHDDFGHNALPSGLWGRLAERYGKPRMTPEVFGPQDAATVLAQRQEVLEGNRQFGEVCRDLLTHDRFDLFLAVFGLVHRGSHYLWERGVRPAGPAAGSGRVAAGGSDIDNMRRVTRLLDQAVREAGVGHLEPAFPDEPSSWRRATEGGLHMGTTRMHVDPQHGVVDENSRVHGTSNLVHRRELGLPQWGVREPDLDVVALALRLGDHLKRVVTS